MPVTLAQPTHQGLPFFSAFTAELSGKLEHRGARFLEAVCYCSIPQDVCQGLLLIFLLFFFYRRWGDGKEWNCENLSFSRSQGFVTCTQCMKKKSTFVRERNIFQVFVKPNYAKRHTSETAIKMFYFLRNNSKGNPLFLPLHTDLQRTESCRGIFEDCIAAANKLVSILGTNL